VAYRTIGGAAGMKIIEQIIQDDVQLAGEQR